MKSRHETHYGVLLAICFCHLDNDLLQSVAIAAYPTFKDEFGLTFAQLGLVTLAYQATASLLQPVVGFFADRRSTPYALPIGTLFTFIGLLALAFVPSYPLLVLGACVFGVGSSVFHPESSRVARIASGGRPGLAQSLFQVGGNAGGALGAVGAALVVSRWGRHSLGAFALAALVSTAILTGVGLWSRRHGAERLAESARTQAALRSRGEVARPSPGRVRVAVAVLVALIFSKFVYLSAFTSYYIFYLVHRFGIPVASAQMRLFALLAAVAAGTLGGGALGDRFGRKRVIWFSILGALPFALALPHVDLFWTGVLTVAIGFVLASAFPAIVVYGQELVPQGVGMVSGLLFGLSFGCAGIGAAALGKVADAHGIEEVYRVVAFLPALGLLAAFLPDLGARSPARATASPELVRKDEVGPAVS